MKSKQGIKHKVYVRSIGVKVDSDFRQSIKKAARAALFAENVDLPCVVSVVLTDDKNILYYNKKYRGIDKATDVLSFPMQTFRDAGWCNAMNFDYDRDSEYIPLGDIVISLDTAIKQAKQNNIAIHDESAYLTVHATLHLLGYDHVSDEDKKIMRLAEKSILSYMEHTV